MKDIQTAPALGGVTQRWLDYPRKDLYNFIRNSQAMIADGHPKAVQLWDQWKPMVMGPYPDLSDEDLSAIYYFVEHVYYQKVERE